MVEIEAMTAEEMDALLKRMDYGHLGCTRDGHPYIVPMHYVYDAPHLYFLTTEGTKTEFIAANSEICFQVEEVTDTSHWQSVMLMGHAQRLHNISELEEATRLITERNPALTPAINETQIGAWHRPNHVATYRVRAEAIYGRKTG